MGAVIERSTFCGASVRDFSSTIGWNGGSGSLTVNLVEDHVNGDFFAPPAIGSPCFFDFYNFRFNGILRDVNRTQDGNGKPVFSVTVADMASVLENVQVILGGFYGPVNAVKNLINAFGYAENFGFGNSGSNEGGMPWPLIRQAIESVVNTPSVSALWGGPIYHMGYSYQIDLSEIPHPDSSYRISQPNDSLMGLIQQICEDGGCDFFIALTGNVIRVRTASRFNQPPLGTISAFVNADNGTKVVRSNAGLEMRNDTTTAFLVGGEIQELNQTNLFKTFWGYDTNGLPIVESGPDPDRPSTFGRFTVLLNATPIAEILSSLTYATSENELRCAKGGVETWLMFICTFRPLVADLIGATAPFNGDVLGEFLEAGGRGKDVVPGMVFNDRAGDAARNARGIAKQNDIHTKVMAVYEFVKGYADEYMGKKFLINLPFILTKTDAETFRVSTSWEVSDGGYLPEGSQPLGLSQYNEDIFRTNDARLKAFCRFDSIVGTDRSGIATQGTVTENNKLFMEVSVDQRIVFTPSPCVVATIASPILDFPLDSSGDFYLLKLLFQVPDDIPQQDQEDAIEALMRNPQHGTATIRIGPACRFPTAFAIPLKSTIASYGPWVAQTAPGKVRYETDPGLTPWNYGGFVGLNTAGTVRVTSAVTNMQVSEQGQLTVEGVPAASLGDILQANGPNISNIEVSVGQSGVTTTYRFQTFSPRFGVFGKGYTDKLRRITQGQNEVKRVVRQNRRDQDFIARGKAGAIQAKRLFDENMPQNVRRKTPHTMLTASVVVDEDGFVTPGVSSATIDEAITFCNADDDTEFQRTACVSLTALFRPYTVIDGVVPGMSSFVGTSINGEIPNSNTLNPFKDINDIEFCTWGSSFYGLRATENVGTVDSGRSLGLRGPLVVTGWGFGFDTRKVPDDWPADYLKKSDTWKTGPVDLLWDQNRGVWSCHGTVRGTLNSSLLGNGSATMMVKPETGTSWPLTVWNFSPNTIYISGTKYAMAQYVASDNKYYVVAVDC